MRLADSAPPMTFSTVAPWKTVKVGVMGYQNLSYCIGKTPKKVSGQKNLLSPVQKTSKSDWRKIWGTQNLDFLKLSARISTPKSIGWPQNDNQSCRYCPYLAFAKKLGGFVQKWPGYDKFSAATWIFLKICLSARSAIRLKTLIGAHGRHFLMASYTP